ncbi:hypothetical protein C8R43DRAFT_975282 [Mycena crocata]|nr:hypothetical protein C8R43DRAFT_975282 [Mycena crocata]
MSDAENDDGRAESGSESDYTSEDEFSVSSFSESELPDKSFRPMPDRLTLPSELQQLVLSCEDSYYEGLWGDYCLVCKAWKEWVEHIAKTEWLPLTSFHCPVSITATFMFHELEGDVAVFRFHYDGKHRERLIDACERAPAPDVYVDALVHDVEIPDMSVDWDTLTLTCPWRNVIGRVLAEELRVVAYRAMSHKDMMTAAKRMRHACGGDVDMENFGKMIELFGENYMAAYPAVRKARLGRTDERGDERLKMARYYSSMRDF